mmetsp:Transcript_10228/g.10194  ORF Transcript_10228/g.10194 Transcript_10228/m.10194 type:complete len:109 (+) Transcript_10228:1633-1959(+)
MGLIELATVKQKSPAYLTKQQSLKSSFDFGVKESDPYVPKKEFQLEYKEGRLFLNDITMKRQSFNEGDLKDGRSRFTNFFVGSLRKQSLDSKQQGARKQFQDQKWIVL